jgi:hypothetical protein
VALNFDVYQGANYSFLIFFVMKATIQFLWDTGRQIISFDNSELDRPVTFSDLKKCDNVIIGKKIDDDPRCKDRVVLIDNDIYVVSPSSAKHVGGTVRFLEIM